MVTCLVGTKFYPSKELAGLDSGVHPFMVTLEVRKRHMANITHEKLLTAVGHVLDLAQPHGFAIRDTEMGLIVETFDENNKLAETFSFDLDDLHQLLAWHAESLDKALPGQEHTLSEGTLSTFLQQHELIGAAR